MTRKERKQRKGFDGRVARAIREDQNLEIEDLAEFLCHMGRYEKRLTPTDRKMMIRSIYAYENGVTIPMLKTNGRLNSSLRYLDWLAENGYNPHNFDYSKSIAGVFSSQQMAQI